MSLIDCISSDIIKIGLVSKDKPSVLRELLQILFDAGRVTDKDEILEAMIRRESLQSTGLEAGIAVPHAKTKAVSQLTLAIGIKPEGIEFNAADGKPSKLFFLLLAPPDKSGPHIEALAEIARISQSSALVNALINASSNEEVMSILGI